MATGPARALGYAPYESLEDRPHVMVDGAPRRSTVLALSHWPQTPTPVEVARDLSVQIVLEFLRYRTGRQSASPHGRAAVVQMLAAARGAEAVTNDHFDEDGLMSILAMMEPETAFEHEKLLVDVASCGDFGVVSSRTAAAACFAIGPLAELEAGSGAGTSERYLAMLPRAVHLLRNTDDYEALWVEEMNQLDEGRAALERGDVEITEDAADLAVVRRVGGTPVRFPGASGALPIHAVAVHSATGASRILAFDGPRCELYFRYESWVRFVSRPVPLRPDLALLAAELTSLEPGRVTWEANAVGAIVARMRPDGEGLTELSPDLIGERVRSYLLNAPPAWDPFGAGGNATARAARRSGTPGRLGRGAGRRRRGAGKRPRRRGSS